MVQRYCSCRKAGRPAELISMQYYSFESSHAKFHCDSFAMHFANEIVHIHHKLDTTVGLVQCQGIIGAHPVPRSTNNFQSVMSDELYQSVWHTMSSLVVTIFFECFEVNLRFNFLIWGLISAWVFLIAHSFLLLPGNGAASGACRSYLVQTIQMGRYSAPLMWIPDGAPVCVFHPVPTKWATAFCTN